MEKPEGKRPFRTPKHRLKDNITFDFNEIVQEDVDRIHS
jgi:hypothetical protein